ncbi:MAG: peptidoglycan DD-metalloendopeptidase family protein [Endomicrobium sp.]|jgi:murein DD-endopeptidase MepM/ murein hydrolase activator NlpD|uniref:M23 family metallopeptidase n=1 Tax=Candidatus Endomicrobiellum cubanum TaxID=3242325 RepID=UPI0028375E95|nr:peptidoglycan DD-metalloendopeptidase family protein [Endomicrobium sp.]
MKKILNKVFIITITVLLIFFIYSILKNKILNQSVKLEKKTDPPIEIEKITIQKGDVLQLTLNKTKLSTEDSITIIKELQKLTNIGHCMPGDFYEITYDKNVSTWTEFCYYPHKSFYYSIIKSSDKQIQTQKKELEISKTEYKFEGTIDSSLWDAMTSKNIPANIILYFADIFAWQIDFLTDTKQGDIFKIIYEIEYIEKTDRNLSSKIIAAQYKTSSKTYDAFYFKTNKGIEGYFDKDGKSLRSAFLKAPLQFRRISSYFSTNRVHPILKYARPHLGIDYAAPQGTPVSSIGDGTVLKAQYSGDFGNLIVIKHNNGYETYYGHLSKYAKGIKKGAKVKQGEVIGYVGMTGLATGPHLDFRIKLNGKFFNFLKMKQPPTNTLIGEDKIDFKNYIQNLIDRLQNNL